MKSYLTVLLLVLLQSYVSFAFISNDQRRQSSSSSSSLSSSDFVSFIRGKNILYSPNSSSMSSLFSANHNRYQTVTPNLNTNKYNSNFKYSHKSQHLSSSAVPADRVSHEKAMANVFAIAAYNAEMKRNARTSEEDKDKMSQQYNNQIQRDMKMVRQYVAEKKKLRNLSTLDTSQQQLQQEEQSIQRERSKTFKTPKAAFSFFNLDGISILMSVAEKKRSAVTALVLVMLQRLVRLYIQQWAF